MYFSSQEVREKFQRYKKNKSRCAVLRTEIKYIECMSYAESDMIVEDVAFKARDLSVIPAGTGTGDPTAAAAIELMECRQTIAHQMGHDLLAMQRELYGLLLECGYVEGWLTGLNERQRFVVENHLIEGIVWSEMEVLYETKFQKYYTSDGLKKMQRAAVAAIVEASR